MLIQQKGDILLLKFKTKQEMNSYLNEFSFNYEGMINPEAHNFPSSFLPKDHTLQTYNSKYIIGVYKAEDIPHELQHAKFYLNNEYRNSILQEWNRLPLKTKLHIEKFLTKLGYSEHVFVDEYQAYKYTEKSNFFGVKMDF